MKKIYSVWLLLLVLGWSGQMHPFSFVYSMKIRRIFNVAALAPGSSQNSKPSTIFTIVPNGYYRKRHIIDDTFGINLKERLCAGGAIVNLRYVPSPQLWAEATTALERESVQSCGTANLILKRTGFDDILLSGGRNFFPTQHAQIVLYGLTGFPTQRSLSPEERYNTLIGTRFFSAGLGAEASYSFIHSLPRSLIGIAQVRFIHFFTRHWEPILSAGELIQPGNSTDLLLTLQYRKKRHIFETGYNPTFFTNQALLLLATTIQWEKFTRESLYATYTYIAGGDLRSGKKPVIFGFGASGAWSKRFHARSASVWADVSILF